MQPLADDDVQYEFKSVQAARGLESRTKTKWQNQGWEFVSESRGTLRTELNFRRIKPKTFGDYTRAAVAAFRGLRPKTQLVLASTGALILIGAAIGIGVAAQSGDPVKPSAAMTTAAPTSVPTIRPSTTPSTTATIRPAAPAPKQIRDISVDGLLDKLNAGGSTVGDRFRVTAELFQSDLWYTGATGDYSVLLKAQGGAQDLEVFVDESKAEKWKDGTKVELVLKNVEKTVDGETSPDWMEVQSAKTLSGGT